MALCVDWIGHAVRLQLGVGMSKIALALTAGLFSVVLVPGAAHAATPTKYQNCTNLQKVYKHGVGRSNAKDHVSSGQPVTTWKKDTAEYNRAMSYNKGLDRDKDGVACEKR